ncbi:MAG: isochorismatase family protein [Lachnospiraceae bacterium]|nr:isochorismatase family protein [Lachnospiraceae bacterium]
MSNKKALVVIDMQNDYLWPERKEMFFYDTDDLVNNVNNAIVSYKEKGYDIIYISQIFPDLPTNRWIIGFSIKNTEGAKLYGGLKIVSDLFFDKNLPDTYSSKSFREHMMREGYSKVAICGLDECGCVGATAKGAAKTGVSVVMLENCIGRRFPDAKVQKMRRQLLSRGIKYITV